MLMSAPPEQFDDQAVDLGDVLARLWAARSWIIVSVVACAAVFVTAAFLMQRVYRASTVLTPANIAREGAGAGLSSALGQLGGLAALAGVNLGGNGADTEEALAVLQSRQFTESFIQERNLMPELFARRWDAKAGRWKDPPGRQPTLAKAFKLFDNRIRSIVRDKKTGLVTLQIDWQDREEAADWANDLVGRLNAEMRGRAVRKSVASVGYLEKELDTTTVVPTREAINRLIESQIKERMFANVNLDYAFRVVDRAMAPDADDPVKPQKILMLVEGALLGLGIGIALVLLFRRHPRRSHPEAGGGSQRPR